MYMWNLKAVMTKELCESSRQLRRHVSETKSVLYCWSSQYDRVLRWQDLDITDEIIYLANPMSLLHNDVIKKETFFVFTGPLWTESSDHPWIPLTKASDVELWCFPCFVFEQQTAKQTIKKVN